MFFFRRQQLRCRLKLRHLPCQWQHPPQMYSHSTLNSYLQGTTTTPIPYHTIPIQFHTHTYYIYKIKFLGELLLLFHQVKGLPFNRYSWLTTHNSFALTGAKPPTGSALLAPTNQEDSITTQLQVRSNSNPHLAFLASITFFALFSFPLFPSNSFATCVWSNGNLTQLFYCTTLFSSNKNLLKTLRRRKL